MKEKKTSHLVHFKLNSQSVKSPQPDHTVSIKYPVIKKAAVATGYNNTPCHYHHSHHHRLLKLFDSSMAEEEEEGEVICRKNKAKELFIPLNI